MTKRWQMWVILGGPVLLYVIGKWLMRSQP